LNFSIKGNQMNLGEIREKFVQFSGRYDLINTDDSDNGADFFINAGQRFLDRRVDFRKSDGRQYKELTSGNWYFKLQNCRTLERVWVNTSEERWQLIRKDLIWLRNEYPSLINATDQGDPNYWAPAILRGMDITDMNNQGTFFNYALAEAGNEDYQGLVILPPPDTSVVVELWGKFYSPTLTLDTNESYWTVTAPETLVASALYRLEIMYRNSEGAKDWLAAIDVDLRDLDKDNIQEDVTNVDTMEG
jgi:hypothetical protein